MKSLGKLAEHLPAGSISRRDFVKRALALGVSLGSIGAFLESCGSGGGGSGGSITWSTWTDAPNLPIFKNFTANYNKTYNANVQFNPVPTANGNYFTKILTELNGGDAPDVFYVDDSDIGKLIANQTITQLDPLLNSSKSKEKATDFAPGLLRAAKTQSGKIFGVPVDSNPIVLWYNETVLQNAGITTMPADLSAQGQWTHDAFQQMINKLKAAGKYGYVLNNSPMVWWSWITANGGQLYADNGYGNFIVNQDPNSLATMTWLADQVRAKTMVYVGSLPKGQGNDVAMISGQTGFIDADRWVFGEFNQAGLKVDCVPFPSSTGKIAPAAIYVAYMVINKKTKLPDQSFDFLTNYVSVDGQIFRLKSGGNAVPSIISPETDKVVTDGNKPQHAQYMLDARQVGYSIPPAEAFAPGLQSDIQTAIEPIFVQGTDVKTTLAQVATMADPRIAQGRQYSNQ
jgi:multiple sugar transport system substrate-binding protein